MRFFKLFAITLAILGLLSCSKARQQEANSGKLKVCAAIGPLKFMAQKIVGDRAEVFALVPPGAEPHTYSPTQQDMARLAQSAAYLAVGMPFEQEALVPRMKEAMPGVRIVDLTTDVPLRRSDVQPWSTGEEEHHDADHAEAGAVAEEHHHHDDGLYDPHIWMNPMLMKVMARNLTRALGEIDPQGTAAYAANLAAFEKDMDQLAQKLQSMTSGVNSKAVLVYHPAWGYLTDLLGIKQIPVEEEGKETTGKHMQIISALVKANNIGVIFISEEFARQEAEKVASGLNLKVVVLNPLTEDYENGLSTTVNEFVAAAH